MILDLPILPPISKCSLLPEESWKRVILFIANMAATSRSLCKPRLVTGNQRISPRCFRVKVPEFYKSLAIIKNKSITKLAYLDATG